MLPLRLAIPTTAGTGSECQSHSRFDFPDEKRPTRKWLAETRRRPLASQILDPSLTLSQPRRVTACAGIDAIAHAVETAATKKRSALSLLYSHAAFKLCVTSFPKVLESPTDLEARGKMLLGAALAGLAIENSMLGAAHSCANPLTTHFGIVHGEAVGLMLPHVIRFNAEDPASALAYAELASAPELACVTDGSAQAVEALVARIENPVLELARNPKAVAGSRCDGRVHWTTCLGSGLNSWTATFNPRALNLSDFKQLFRAAL